MRILLGFANHIPQILEHRRLSGYGHEFLFFDHNIGHFKWTPEMSWNDIANSCPGGPPDIYIHWSVEYNPLPVGIDKAECFTVGVFGDWNLGGRAIHSVKGMFDLWVSDKPGGTVLERHGLVPSVSALLWAQHPTTHVMTTPPGSIERDIDILLIGNLNHEVQHRRAPLLARIARLARNHNVLVATGVYGPDYTSLMNRAKIVFNHSIRGEANMRAFEGPACGALTFNETGNEELTSLFVHRKTHIEYTSENLETLLDYYLDPANAQERITIAEEGHRLVTNHSYADHLRRLLDRILPEYHSWQAGLFNTSRQSTHSSSDKSLDIARQWLTSLTPAAIPLAHKLCATAGSEQAMLLSSRVLSEWARFAESTADRSTLQAASVKLAEDLVSKHPQSLECALVMAAASLAANDIEQMVRAEARLREPLVKLFDGNYPPIMSRTMDEFDVIEDEMWLEFGDDPPKLHAALTNLTRARLLAVLADRHLAEGRLQEAMNSAREAQQLLPRSNSVRYLAARCLRALGLVEDGLCEFADAIECNPFHWQCRTDLVTLALEVQDIELAGRLLKDWDAILQAMPVYRYTQPILDQLLAALTQLQKQTDKRSILRHLMVLSLQSTEYWREPLVRYLTTTSNLCDSLLLLRVEASAGVSENTVRSAIADVVRTSLGERANPPIVVITQSINCTDRWKLFRGCSLVIDTPALSALDRLLADNQNIPIVQTATNAQYAAA